MTTQLEEQVRETAEQIEEAVRASTATVAETFNDGKRSTERLLRKGRYAVEDGVEEATHRIKRDPFGYVTAAFAAGTITGIVVGLLLRRGGKKGS
jgi:ElaB/YqjD/DUF883 family membrane-anchored ribosome-binding protein